MTPGLRTRISPGSPMGGSRPVALARRSSSPVVDV